MVFSDHCQREVYPRRNTSGRPNVTVPCENSICLKFHSRISSDEVTCARPMRCRIPTVQQSRLGEKISSSAHACDTHAAFCHPLNEGNRSLALRRQFDPFSSCHDER